MTGSGEKKDEFDYIIVGSGAGGAPLAARLVKQGKRVLVIEAGSNHTTLGAQDPGNEISRVPLLHAASTEHPDLAWRYFVEHYERDPGSGALPDGIGDDPKRNNSADPTQDGIFYPRASGIGGCTIHNALITIAGPDSDWDDLANYLGDASWNGRAMRTYFQRMENCSYLKSPTSARLNSFQTLKDYCWNSIKYLFGFRPDLTSGQHGFGGWLNTRFTDLSIGLSDRQLVKMIKAALKASKRRGLDNAWFLASTFFKGKVWQTLDPNHAETQANSPEGVVLIPLSVYGSGTTIHQNRATPYAMLGRRSSPREFLLETLGQHPDRLEIWTDCLVTKVLLEEIELPDGTKKQQAVGVELLRGKKLYRAHVNPADKSSGTHDSVRVKAGGEVILCGGAFNTPQLLMLSGIGDPKVLAEASEKSEQKISCLVELPGVGKNLQDRYEVSVVSQMKQDFSLLENATFNVPSQNMSADPHLRRWREEGTGLYTSNGGVLGIFKRSRPELSKPDLFIFGVPSEFRGYQVGYSQIRQNNLFTWIILKSHTQNQQGYVKLRNTDPCSTPLINFHYFGTGSPHDTRVDSSHDVDVKALISGVNFVREIAGFAKSVVKCEVHPADRANNDSSMNHWIRQDAWGHHACGTCRMGRDGDPNAVLDSRFRVRGVENLRVVDASIFPRIPGYFIVSNIYMASEKAADVILEDEIAKQAAPTSSVASYYPFDLWKAERKAIKARRELTSASRLYEPGKASAEPASVQQASIQQENVQQEGVQQENVQQEGVQQENVQQEGVQQESVQQECDPSESGQPESVPPENVPPASVQPESVLIENATAEKEIWNADVTGLALSGGGIRSATLGLGLLQTMARKELLRRVDFLSTVSGGGYIGSFLGRCFDRQRKADRHDGLQSVPPDLAVERILTDHDSPAIQWLRSHGNYIAPQGGGDNRLNLAIFVRNLLSLHVVIGIALFALFGVTNALRYGLFERVLSALGFVVHPGDLPIGHLVESLLGPWFSPWFILVEVLLLFLVLPRIVAYWIVSQDKHESFKMVPIFLMFGAALLLLWLGAADGFKLDILLLGIALLTSLIHVELAWKRGRDREAALGSGGVETQRLRTRNYLTYDLGLALALTGMALAFTVIDTLGHGLQQWKLSGNITYAEAFASLAAAIMAVIPLMRYLAGFFKDSNESSPPSTLKRLLKGEAVPTILAIVLFTLPLVTYSFAAHAVYQGGNAVDYGLLVTAGAIGISILLALPSAVVFINRSSLSQTYAARLARAYLGASNPARHRPEGMNVTEVVPGDDVPSIRDYRPHEGAGPLHIINVTINATVDETSGQKSRDRKGTSMAVSALAVSVGQSWHACWTDPSQAGMACVGKAAVGLDAIGNERGAAHPLIDQLGRSADRAEMLSLRQWIGISGAAIDPGRGRTTRTGIALLMGLLNMRTGYWWDSGISAAERNGWPVLSPIRRFLYLIPRYFATQSLIVFEWLARYPGPWERFWHISDGGYFENLAAYELVRRRVPRIIVNDGGADPSYEFEDFAEFVRKVRIDFNARVESWTEDEIDALVTNQLISAATRKVLGSVKELQTLSASGAGPKQTAKHACLCWVHYPSVPNSTRSLLLYVKASVNGDESADIAQYLRSHQEFPHESTGDQFFDEAQWESYRKLGEHIGKGLMETDWFWRIRLPSSEPGAA